MAQWWNDADDAPTLPQEPARRRRPLRLVAPFLAVAVVGTGVGLGAVLLNGRSDRGDRGGEQRSPERSSGSTSADGPVALPPATPTVPDEFPPIEPSRWIPTDPGMAVVADEATLLARADTSRTQIEELVAGLGGGFTGGDDALHAYQARFPDLTAALAALQASPLLLHAEQVTGQLVGDASVPSQAQEIADWSDDDDAQTWTFDQAGATDAWNAPPDCDPLEDCDPQRGRGDPSVEVGVVDTSIYEPHSDLTLASYDHPGFSEDPTAFYEYLASTAKRGTEPYSHGTHVAGTICLPDGNGGLVGVMQRCTLRALELYGTSNQGPNSYRHYVATISAVRRWLERYPDLKVVNVSEVWFGAHRANDCAATVPRGTVDWAKQAFGGDARLSQTLFVVAANNCGHLNGGARSSVAHALPPALKGLPNVITVSATARRNGDVTALAYYSNVDGDVAAPGGGGDEGDEVWSTTWGRCADAPDPWCRSTWGRTSGTSMAAPFVTGTAGLMLSANPMLTAEQLRSCITGEANVTDIGASRTDRSPAYGLREIRVEVAVDCAASLRPSESGSWEPLPYRPLAEHERRAFESIVRDAGVVDDLDLDNGAKCYVLEVTGWDDSGSIDLFVAYDPFAIDWSGEPCGGDGWSRFTAVRGGSVVVSTDACDCEFGDDGPTGGADHADVTAVLDGHRAFRAELGNTERGWYVDSTTEFDIGDA